MPHPKPKAKPAEPFMEAWLRRTRKKFSGSGRISQAALIFSQEEGETQEIWQRRLRSILNGRQAPTVEVLARLDKLAAGNPVQPEDPPSQAELF